MASRPKTRASKSSYAIPCSSVFRDRLTALAQAQGVNVGDLARSVMLTVPPETIDQAPDPGDPAQDDRETVTLKSGANAGRPWRRKPRLQVRLPAGQDPVRIRRALGLALSLSKGELRLVLEESRRPTRDQETARLRDTVDRMRTMIETLSFEKMPHGVRTRDEALYILGFPPWVAPTPETVRARFRLLATIHHPDSGVGDNERMALINQAMSFLRRG